MLELDRAKIPEGTEISIYGIHVNKVWKEIEDFNRGNVNPIYMRVRVSKPNNLEHILLGAGGLDPFHLSYEPKTTFSFEVGSFPLAKKHTYSSSDEAGLEAYKAAQLYSQIVGIRHKIHCIIFKICISVIRDFERAKETWHRYLSFWHRESTHTETLAEALENYDVFLHSLEGKVYEYLKRYYPKVLDEIQILNAQYDKLDKEHTTLLCCGYVQLEVESSRHGSINDSDYIIKYDYNFDKKDRRTV